ncbi:MAG: phage tail tube protein [Rhizomicrobium sp.]
MVGNPKLSARKVLVAEIETSYGVDIITSDPGAAHGILGSNFSFAPMAATVSKRQRAHALFGADPVEITQKHATLGVDVEMGGAGVPGDPPLYGALLRCCGLEETLTATVNAMYTPLTDDTESTSLHFNQDGLQQRLTGCRGTASLKIAGGALPLWTFAIQGLWNAATDAALPDVHADLEAFLDAAEVNVANTTCSLFGIDVVLDTLTVDVGNTVMFRDRPNAAYVAITDRSASGSITFEADAIATYDWESAAAAKTTGALALVQGTEAGNEVSIAAPRVQLGNPTYADQSGILCVTIPLYFLRTDGDDELTFTIR